MLRWITPASLLLATVAAAPAPAAPKPITGAYQVTVPVSGACRAGIPGSEDLRPVTLPGRGRIVIDLAGRGYDMDLELLGKHGAVALSHRTGVVEKINYRVKVPGKYVIRVCNYIAGPMGDVTFTFTQ